ncbi:MAG TPA: S8 family serine peptidase, partial [Pirellulales bacterium]|nr:S8 family serine peptidase [Pirellulales bacterium]
MSFFNRLLRTSKPRRRSPNRTSRLRLDGRTSLRMETLEQRRLLSIDVAQSALQAFEGANPGGKNGPLADVGWDLSYLYYEHQSFEATNGAGPFTASNSLLHVTRGSVLIDASPSGSMTVAETQLADLGMQITGAADEMISGYLPIDEIPALAALASVKFTDPDYGAVESVGSVTSQGDATIAANNARTYLGLDGTGVTVGVLSDSYNHLGGAAADIASGDLPAAGVNVIQDDNFAYDTDEGRAMLQIVHDVAPGAALDFATAEGGETNFANNITALKNAGAKVIVDDSLYYAEPMFQDGAVAQAVESAVNAGTVYVSAAGNEGTNSLQSSWRAGPVLASGAIPSASGAPAFAGGTTFDFDPSGNTNDMQSVTLQPGATMTISLQWDSPFYSVSGGSGSQNDLDVYLLNSAGAQVLAGSTTRNTGGDPVEVFQYTNTGGTALNANLMITKYSGADPGLIKYVMFQSGAPVAINTFATNSSMIYGHANASNDVAVGAEYWGSSPATLESFSSVGPTQILFDTSGNRITPVTRNHPDVVGPDGVATTMSSFSPFYGTSAASPHVAGVAALMLQSQTSATPAQVDTALEQTATDMGATGYDYSSGYGLIQAPQAILALGGHNTVTIDGTNDPSADAFKVVYSNGNDQFYVNNTLVLTGAVSGIANIVVKGSAYNDSLTVDGSNGNPVPSGGITFNGAGGTNSLSLTAYASFSLANNSLTLSGPTSGAVSLSSVTQATLTDSTGNRIGPFPAQSFSIDGWQGSATANLLGADSATLHAPSGSSGNTFTAHPTNSSLTGTGYSYSTTGGGTVAAHGASGSDVAHLYDDGTQTANNFYSHPTYAGFYGTGFSEYATGFGTFTGAASNSGDGALLLDDGTQSANNFYAHPTYAGFYGTGFSEYVSGFEHVTGQTANVNATAQLLDDGATNAHFYGHATNGPNTGPAATFLGSGWRNDAIDFTRV